MAKKTRLETDLNHYQRICNPLHYQLCYLTIKYSLKVILLRLIGVEPITFGTEIRCSIQLSYKRNSSPSTFTRTIKLF